MKTQPFMLMPTFFQHLSWAPVRLVMFLFAKMEIKGLENTKLNDGNMILASNHINHLDPVLLSACFPFFSRHIPFIFGSREKNFYQEMGWKAWIYGGTFFRLMGAYPMTGGLKDYAISMQKHIEFVKKGKSFCMFPKGKERGGETKKTKGGIGYIAYATGIPVVPVKITGIENMTFASVWSGRHKAKVTFGKPIYKEELFPKGLTPIITPESNPFVDAAELIMKKVSEIS